MSYEETDQKAGPANLQSGADTDTELVKLPLKIDDAIMVRSLTNSSHVANSRIIGAVHGDYILIKDPTVRVTERYSVVLDDSFLCSYFNEGFLYTFHSRYRRELMNDLVCIEYPHRVEIRKIRRDRRINVNIETELVIEGVPEPCIADMIDISRGGCGISLDGGPGIQVGTAILLKFALPNGALINEIQATVVRINRIKGSSISTLGCIFKGAAEETSKVANFCDFCMFFEVQ